MKEFKRKKIFIIQHYSPNKGDSAVLGSMISSLQEKYNDIKISVSSYDPSITKQLYGVETVNWIIDFKALKKKNISIGFKELLLLLYDMLWVFLSSLSITLPHINKNKAKVINAYLKSDVVVVPGGHFFTSLNNFPTLFCHCIALYVAQVLGKPTMIYSHTIGPFTGGLGFIKKSLSKFVLNKVNIITVREKQSSDVLKNMGISKPDILTTAETVFLMQPPDKKKSNNILKEYGVNGNVKIGITIHHIYYKYYFSKTEYINLMAQIADFLAKKIKASVVFIPMEMKYDHGGDRPMAKEIIERMQYSESATLLDGEFTPQETLGIIDQMNLFVGTKTHSIVFSLLRSKPTLSISYHSKSTEFMEQLGVKEFAIPLEMLCLDEFEKKIEKLWVDQDKVSECISSHLIKVKQNAEKNNQLLIDLTL